MDPYIKMINLCKQIAQHHKEQEKRYSEFISKRMRRLFTEIKKTAEEAKERSIAMDKEQENK
ncbi:hypothetical protein D1872_347600 [compost metagenome]